MFSSGVGCCWGFTSYYPTTGSGTGPTTTSAPTSSHSSSAETWFSSSVDSTRISSVKLVKTHQMDLHYIHYLNTLNEASIRPNLSFTHLLDLIHCIMHRIKPHLSCVCHLSPEWVSGWKESCKPPQPTPYMLPFLLRYYTATLGNVAYFGDRCFTSYTISKRFTVGVGKGLERLLK